MQRILSLLKTSVLFMEAEAEGVVVAVEDLQKVVVKIQAFIK